MCSYHRTWKQYQLPKLHFNGLILALPETFYAVETSNSGHIEWGGKDVEYPALYKHKLYLST